MREAPDTGRTSSLAPPARTVPVNGPVQSLTLTEPAVTENPSGRPRGTKLIGRLDPPRSHGGELRPRARQKRWRSPTPLARCVSAEKGRRRRCESIGAAPSENGIGDSLSPLHATPHGFALGQVANGSQGRDPLGAEVGCLRREPGEQHHVCGLNGRGPLRSASGRGGGNVNRFVPALDSVHRIEHRSRNEGCLATANKGIDPRRTKGNEHVLVPVGHFISSDRAGEPTERTGDENAC
jgi:hypothetical protein